MKMPSKKSQDGKLMHGTVPPEEQSSSLLKEVASGLFEVLCLIGLVLFAIVATGLADSLLNGVR